MQGSKKTAGPTLFPQAKRVQEVLAKLQHSLPALPNTNRKLWLEKMRKDLPFQEGHISTSP